jgi:uncharacterized protein DUF4864
VRLGLALGVALAALVAAPAARAQLGLKGAADTVLGQLDAFRRDDYDAAYAFASEEIRRTFDRAAFERMVKTGYPEIARSRSAAVEHAAVAPNGHAYLVLKIRGANGTHIEAIYDLVWETDRWKISGVVTRPDDELV